MPSLVKDVYRDLRDRRLLVIAIALIAAMIAVPFLVKGSDATVGADAGLAAVQTDPGPLDAATLTQEPALRDYLQRFGELRSKNPFKQQLTGAGGQDAGEEGGGDGSGSGGGGIETQESLSAAVGGAAAVTSEPAEPAASSAPVVEDPAAEESDPAATDEDPEDEPKEPDPVEDEPPSPDPKPGKASYTIDVRIGTVGDMRVIRDVEKGGLLPGENRPALRYVGSSPADGSASFDVSDEVTDTNGEGKCSRGETACGVLRLKVGESHVVVYGPDYTRFRVELLAMDERGRVLADGASPYR